jgi:hypothetical protein
MWKECVHAYPLVVPLVLYVHLPLLGWLLLVLEGRGVETGLLRSNLRTPRYPHARLVLVLPTMVPVLPLPSSPLLPDPLPVLTLTLMLVLRELGLGRHPMQRKVQSKTSC